MFKGLFNYDNAFWRFMGRIGDFVLLSILFLLCSIPVITFGAALCAVYSVIFSMIEGRDSGILKGFIKGIKQNIKHGMILSVCAVLIFGLLYMDFKLLPVLGLSQNIYYLLLGLMMFTAIVMFSLFIYIFPLEARYTNSFSNHLKNSLLLSFRNLPKTILMAVLDIAIIYLGFLSLAYIPQLFVLPLLIAVPLTAWINSALLKKELKLEAEVDDL